MHEINNVFYPKENEHTFPPALRYNGITVAKELLGIIDTKHGNLSDSLNNIFYKHSGKPIDADELALKIYKKWIKKIAMEQYESNTQLLTVIS